MGTTYLPILLQKYLSNPANKALSMSSFRITNVADPINNQDAATRAWVVANFSGGGASTGSLPFNLTSGATTFLTFAVSGANITLNNPNPTGKIQIIDTDGLDMINVPTTITDNTTGNALTLTNSNLGDGMHINNSGGGNSLHLVDTGTGVGLRVNKSSNGRAVFFHKSGGTGTAVEINDDNTSSASTLLVTKTTAGDVINITKNTGTGNSINITDSGISEAVLINKNNTGRGLSIIKNASAGIPLHVNDTNNDGSSSVQITKNAASTGPAVEIIKSGTDAGQALLVNSSSGSGSSAVQFTNTGAGDCLRVLDQTGDTSGFIIGPNGEVGINSPFSGSLTNKVLQVINGSSNSVWDSNSDIILGSAQDIYLGQTGSNSRPRIRLTYRNESAGADAGTIYFQYSGNSSSANQRFSFTKGSSNEASLNILPYTRKVMIGSIDSLATPNATLGVVPPPTTADPTVLISRNTTGTLRNPLTIEGSNNNVQFNNEGNLGIGFPNQLTAFGADSTISLYRPILKSSQILFSEDITGVNTNCSIRVSDNGSARFLNLNNIITPPFTETITILGFGQFGSEFDLFDSTSVQIGGTNFENSSVQALYNGTSGDQLNIISAYSNSSGTAANFILSNADINLFTQGYTNLISNNNNNSVRVIGTDVYDTPSTASNITFNANTASNNDITSSTSGTTTLKSQNTSGTSRPIQLNCSEVNLSTSTGGAVKIKNLSNPTLPSDAATKAYVDSATGGGVAQAFSLTSSSAGDANNWPIINLPLTQVNPNDATSKNYVDTKTWTGSNVFGFTLNTNGNANNNQITNLSNPSAANQAMRSTFDSYPSSAGARQAILNSSKPIYGSYISTQFWLESNLNPPNFSILPSNNIYLLCSTTSTNLNMQRRAFTNVGTQTNIENAPVAYTINNPQPGFFVGTWVLSKPGYYRIRCEYVFGVGGVQLTGTNFSTFRICQSNVNTTPVNTDFICNPNGNPYEISGYLTRQSANTVYLRNEGEIITSTQNGVYITICCPSSIGAPNLGLGNLMIAGNSIFTFDYLGEFYA